MQLPVDFINEMTELLGKEEAGQLTEALASPSPTSIRLNRRKSVNLDFEDLTSKVDWCQEGLYLNNRPSFTLDPLFHAGCYYVQEASSMYVSHLIKQYAGNEPLVALDLCAAPGGKSTLMENLLPDGSILFANEIIPKRAQILRENLSKWIRRRDDGVDSVKGIGEVDVIVTNNKAGDYRKLGCVFDLMLCDVPCSGEGMFRKDVQAIEEWSANNVEMCWKRQREILEDVWDCLKPGGLMIYSTCTFNTKEDEENVIWIRDELGAEVLPCHAKTEWNITGSLLKDEENLPCCHFFPHKVKGEGFFCAILRKRGDANKYSSTYNGNGLLTKAKKVLKVLPTDNCFVDGEKEVKTYCDVECDTAIQYLRGEAIRLPDSTPRGYVWITYKEQPLGLVKNIGNRANNLYPKEWRIRKQI